MKKFFVSFLIVFSVFICGAQQAAAQDSIRFETGETLTAGQVREIIYKCGAIAGAYQANEDLLAERDRQLSDQAAETERLKKLLAAYETINDLLKQAVDELKKARAASRQIHFARGKSFPRANQSRAK